MKKSIAAAVMALALTGCADAGPWDGPFGFKAGLSPDEVKSQVDIKPSDQEPPNSDVTLYHGNSTAKYDGGGETNVVYAFGKESGLCAVIVSEKLERGSMPGVIQYLVGLYGKPDLVSGAKYVYPTKTTALPDDVLSMEVFIWEASLSAQVNVTYTDVEACH